MAQQVYTVVGATGKIGHVIVEHLVKKGHRVRALGRDKKKLDGLKNIGAETFFVEHFDKEGIYDTAFSGSDAAFLMIPPGYDQDDLVVYQDRVGEVLVKAVEKCAPSHVVNLSSLGAHLSDGVGPIKGLHSQEERLGKRFKGELLNLRPSYFMENLLWSIPTLLRTGLLKTTLDPEIAIPMIATEDIGIKAAEFLELLNFQGKRAYEFTGPRPLTMPEVARIIGTTIGQKNLRYVQQSYDEAKTEMLTLGMKPKVADLMIEMYRAFNQGKGLPTQKLTSDQRGKTTVEQFITKTFVKAYQEHNKIGAH